LAWLQENYLIIPDDSKEKALLTATAADEVRASDIVILDIHRVTLIADFFVICTARSDTQMQAIAERIGERVEERGWRVLHREGQGRTRWMLLDLGDVVVHIFEEEARRLYNLEQLWADAEWVEWAANERIGE
jgi:ribosome-associated protein